MSDHRDLILDDVHALTARTYADVAARDADTAFNTDLANIDKKVRVDSPNGYFMLFSVGPTLWLDASSMVNNFTDLLDTPSSHIGQAGRVLQENAVETALEFGQALRTTDSPAFDQVTLGDTGLVVGASTPFSDVAGLLTLQNVDVLDAITKATIEAAIDTLANLTSIQGQTVFLSGSLTVEAASVLNQDLTTDANPTFAVVSVGGTGLQVGASVPFSDAAGVLTLQSIDLLDAITEATIEAAIDTLPNLTSVQAQTISLSGPLTVELASILNQDLTTDANPTFNDLVLTGSLFVQGDEVRIDSTILVVEDKNIEIGNVAVPTNITGDGGGWTLLGGVDGDKTILWLNATDRWTFNRGIDLLGNNLTTTGVVLTGDLIAITSALAGNLQLSGNTLSSINANGDILIIPNGTGGTLIGTGVAPDGTLHVRTGSAGSVTAISVADGIVLEDATDTGYSVLTPDASVGRFIFGSPGDPFGAFLAWSFSGSDFAVGTSKIGASFRLTSDQETTNLTLSGGVGSELATFAKDVQVIGDLNNFGLNGNLSSFAAGSNALGATTTGTQNVAIGVNAGQSLLTGSDNVFLGFAAGASVISSNFCVGIGKSALASLLSGDNNVAVGEQALQAITTQAKNTALGGDALKKHTAANTVAIGFNAMVNNTVGALNTALGFEALGNNISGGSSTAVGHHAMKFTIAGFNVAVGADAMTGAVGLPTAAAANNVAVGASALNALTSGSSNVAIGKDAMSLATVTKSNVAVGANALGMDTAGDFNVAIGHDALKQLTVADDNIAIGFAALQNVTTGIDNIGIGCLVGEGIVTGSRNILIGEEANFATDVSDMLNIGNSLFLSMATSNFLGLGVPSPTSSIHIQRAGQTEIALEAYSAVNSIPVLSFKRSDSDVKGTHAAVDAGDILGLVDFYGSNGTVFLSSAQMLTTAEETFTATSAATSLRYLTTPVGSVVPLERMVITPSGNVVIGISLLAGNLQLLANTLSSSDTNGNIIISPNGTGRIFLEANGNSVLTVDSLFDNVGIGTTSPVDGAILELSSTTKAFLNARLTSTQRDELPAVPVGLEFYNTTLDKQQFASPTGFKTVLTEDIGTSVAQESFASTNVRFFGELALPTAQGWTDVATGSATIDLQTQLVFDESKQVVRHNDDFTNGSTTSSIALTGQNWTDINAFGAVYSGTSRLDTTDGAGGFFSGLQANSAENPLATGNRRYGILFADDVGNLKATEPDGGTTVTFDGTGGNPLILFDEWFSWECVVPVGLGAAQFFINGTLTTFAPTFRVNGGGLGTKIIVSSGSTGGANRISYHDNFGVTIFEESETKTLLAATMAANIAQVNIPEGRRDYTIILPDGNPRELGSIFRVVANNLFGKITLENQNPAAPEILYNGLRTLVIDVFIKETIGSINTVNQGNVYLGFKDEDVGRAESIIAQLSSSVDQLPVDTNPTVITYNTQDEINGIGHSTSLNPGELKVLPGFGGLYFVFPQPQVGKDQGATSVDFDMFIQVDRGSGFVDEPNSNIKLTIKDQDITDVIISMITLSLNAGDKIRIMQRVSDSSVGMGLKSTAAVVGPPTTPATPSIIFAMARIGGL